MNLEGRKLLEELRQDSSFTPTEIADLDTSFQLADLTRGDFSVVKMLKQEFSVRQPKQIRTLAKRSESEWVDLVRRKHAAGEIKLRIEIGAIAGKEKLPEAEMYGKMLDRQFREAFPMTAFTGGLERALQNGGSQGLSRARDMNRFLERHTSFEFLNTPVDKFLHESTDPEFRELVQNRDFRREVKAVQRVFKLAPTSDIAAEYFGVGSSVEPTDPNEKTLILDAVPDEQQEIWGEVKNAQWLEAYSSHINDIIDRSVCNVRHFIQKTGLEYAELLALLDLKFINPAGDFFIQRLDISCDTDKEVIQGLGAVKLDRIHRFLRLWRKLKTWTMWELDLVIRHPRIGNGVLNEAFLVNLFYFSELKKKLGGKTTVEQVCDLFDNLNTETHFTKRHEKREEGFYPSLFLNKRLINPLDLGFQLDPVTNNLPIGNHYRAPPSCPSNIGAARNRGGCEKS